MTIRDIQSIVEVTRTLFQGARSQPAEQFQDWALEQIQPLLPFDSGKWVSGSVQYEGGVARGVGHAIHLFRQPEALMQHYFPRQEDDLLLATVLQSPGSTVNLYDVVPRTQWESMSIYRDYCKPNGIEHALSTAIPDRQTGLLTVLAIFRDDYAHGFSAEEQRMKNLLTPLLADARNLNLFMQLKAGISAAAMPCALCDIRGVLRESEPAFVELLVREWPQWQGPALRFTPELLLAGQQEAEFHGSAITIKLSVCHDLVLLQARRRDATDQLTAAERHVMEQLMQGKSNKEIARALHISPKTVSHHLHSIYKKIGVANRKQAQAKFTA